MQPYTLAVLDSSAALFILFFFYGGMCFFGAILFAFWIWMIIDCAKNEPPGSDKIVWIIIVVVLNWVGAIVYFFARRKNRAKGQFFRPQSPPPSG